MAGGINMDEEKRRLQYMQFRAEQNLENNNQIKFEQKQVKDKKSALTAAGIILVVLLVVFLLNQAGVI